MGFWSSPLLASLTGAVGITPRCEAEYEAATRSPFWLLEIDVPRCSLTYASAPCTAVDLGDGLRCFKSRRTCQDTANFTSATWTMRFIENHVSPDRAPNIYASYGQQLWPSLSKVSPVAQQIDTGNNFTLQGAMTFSLFDQGSSNALITTQANDVPPFHLDQATPRNTARGGQFWRRFVQIWPNFRNFEVRLKRGFCTSTFTIYDLETKWRGKIENIGFESQGNVTLKVGTLYGGEVAGIEKQAPPKPNSNKVATADHSRSATTIAVADGSLFTNPASVSHRVWLRHVGASGVAESIELTAVSGDNLTVTRAQKGTFGEPILEGDELQEEIPYLQSDGAEGWHPADIFVDLMRRAGIPDADVDGAQIRAECTAVAGLRLARRIHEGAAVKKLATEVCELIMGALYGAESLKIRLSLPQPRRPGSAYGQQSGTETISDTPHILGSPEPKAYTNDNERLTHVVIAHGKLEDSAGIGGGEWGNYVLAINAETFAAAYYGNTDEDRREKRIETEWIPLDTAPASYRAADVSGGVANTLAVRIVSRRGFAPLVFEFSTDLRNRQWCVGDTVTLSTVDWQTPVGGIKSEVCRVIKRVDDGKGDVKLTLHGLNLDRIDAATGQPTAVRWAFIAPDSTTDAYGSASAGEKQYGYFGDASNLVGSDHGYRVY